jgi:hypothetical protein
MFELIEISQAIKTFALIKSLSGKTISNLLLFLEELI